MFVARVRTQGILTADILLMFLVVVVFTTLSPIMHVGAPREPRGEERGWETTRRHRVDADAASGVADFVFAAQLVPHLAGTETSSYNPRNVSLSPRFLRSRPHLLRPALPRNQGADLLPPRSDLRGAKRPRIASKTPPDFPRFGTEFTRFCPLPSSSSAGVRGDVACDAEQDDCRAAAVPGTCRVNVSHCPQLPRNHLNYFLQSPLHARGGCGQGAARKRNAHKGKEARVLSH